MKETFKYLSLITQLGLTITIIVIIFTFFGVYLDRLLNKKALFTLVFVLVGCFAAIWIAYKIILKSLPDSETK